MTLKIKEPVKIIIDQSLLTKITDAAELKGANPYEILSDCIEIGLHVLNPKTSEDPTKKTENTNDHNSHH